MPYNLRERFEYGGRTKRAHQNSQTLWNPNLSVQSPIMPQSGMRIVTTFVTTNCPSARSAPGSTRRRRERGQGTHHLLGADLPPFLYVPEAERAGGARDRLREPEVRVLQERERELVVLAERHERARRVQALPTTRQHISPIPGRARRQQREEEERTSASRKNAKR